MVEIGRGDDGFSSSSIDMDRASQLPDTIWHHILSFLSQQEATRTSVLSKSWRHRWFGRPVIEFRQSSFSGGNEETTRFLSVLDNTLQRYHNQSLSVQRFIVEMSSFLTHESKSLIEKWVPIVLMNMGVETLHLIIPDKPYIRYKSEFILQAGSLKELYLDGCYLKTVNNSVMLQRLQRLSLSRVYDMTGDLLEYIMASCPLLESVHLCECRGLGIAELNKEGHNNNTNLKHFEYSSAMHDVEIHAPIALETIKITGHVEGHWGSYRCAVQIISCPNDYHFPRLKSVHLSDAVLSSGLIETFSCSFPCLEDLELRGCIGFKQIDLSSTSIKNLVIVEMGKGIRTITIDIPNILYFEFAVASCLPSFSFASPASKDWKSNISLYFKPMSNGFSAWLLKLNDVLKSLRQSQITLNLFNHWRGDKCISGANLDSFCKPVMVEHLSLRCCFSSDSFAALFNCWFRMFRPRYIDIGMSLSGRRKRKGNKLAEFICKNKIGLEDGEFSRRYFWHQDLKEFSIEIFEDGSKEWCRVQGSDLAGFALTETQLRSMIRFRFEWRD